MFIPFDSFHIPLWYSDVSNEGKSIQCLFFGWLSFYSSLTPKYLCHKNHTHGWTGILKFRGLPLIVVLCMFQDVFSKTLNPLCQAAENDHKASKCKQSRPLLLNDFLQEVVIHEQRVTLSQALYYLASRSAQLNRYASLSVIGVVSATALDSSLISIKRLGLVLHTVSELCLEIGVTLTDYNIAVGISLGLCTELELCLELILGTVIISTEIMPGSPQYYSCDKNNFDLLWLLLQRLRLFHHTILELCLK